MSEPSSPALPPDPSRSVGGEAELSVHLGAFLPEGTELGHEPEPDPWGDAAPEPEVPAWARTDGSPSDGTRSGVSAPQPAHPGEEIDLDALAVLEGDLDAVDAALVALDAGEPARSPLLVELLGL